MVSETQNTFLTQAFSGHRGQLSCLNILDIYFCISVVPLSTGILCVSKNLVHLSSKQTRDFISTEHFQSYFVIYRLPFFFFFLENKG